MTVIRRAIRDDLASCREGISASLQATGVRMDRRRGVDSMDAGRAVMLVFIVTDLVCAELNDNNRTS